MPIKYPCSSCQKPCKSNQRCICCDVCQLWTHLKCTTLTPKEFDILGNSDLTYFCQSCINDTFPFSLITDAELLDEVNSGKQTFQKAHLPNFAKVWQEVPPEIKLCSFPSFKFKLKKYYLNKYVTIN